MPKTRTDPFSASRNTIDVGCKLKFRPETLGLELHVGLECEKFKTHCDAKIDEQKFTKLDEKLLVL